MNQLTVTQQKAKDKAKTYFFSQGASSASVSGVGAAASWPLSNNIVGIGIGAKVTQGEALAGQDAVHVYVKVKIPQRQLISQEMIPNHFGDLQTDVIEVGEVNAFPTLKSWQRFGRQRPFSCGVSGGHPGVTAGTLGCLVSKNGQQYILSNNHVLANCNVANVGDAILQPGTLDGGLPASDAIATLTDFEPLDFSGAANEMDAAIALVNDDPALIVEPDIIEIGRPAATVKTPTRYQSVRKHGRTTGHTVGVIMALSVDLWVSYGLHGRAWFEDQISILGVGSAPFSQGGDSGSLIVDAVSLEPVALLFAGGTTLTYASPIERVLGRFNATVIG